MFHPKSWIVPAVCLLLGAGFAALGRWQLARAEVNRAVENRFALAESLPALDRPVDGSDAARYRFRRITLSGRYRAEAQVLLDNMTRDGRAGYEVLTPFSVAEADRLVVVNRGWVPAAWNRDELPDIEIGNAARTLSGRIDRLPRAGLALGSAAPTADARPVVVMSFPDFDDLEAVLGHKVYPFQLLLDASEGSGFRRDWQPPAGLDQRNIAYAVQWFGLSAVALVIGIGAVIRGWRGAAPAAR